MTPKSIRLRFEKLPNNNVYGCFEVTNDSNEVILGSSEFFTIPNSDPFLKPSDWNSVFYIKLETIYRLLDWDLNQDITNFSKRLLNGDFIDITKPIP